MNEVINLLKNHRSIRAFKDKPLQEEQIRTIVEAAQSASTSSYYQAYSIIGVTDKSLKEELRKVSGQHYVENNAHLFVFCADMNRMFQSQLKEIQEKMMQNIENTEFFMMSVIDAALAAQNAAIACESMDLGICYIGSLRNNINRVNDLLKLPKYVIPLFGMVIGYPDENPEIKPRFNIDAIYFENEYKLNHDSIQTYDNLTEKYYRERSTNTRQDNWSKQIGNKLINPIRMDVASFVQSKGLNKH
ncbi:oxygen-insensitive NADPH nitroreductase [Bacillaceae bacterium W0354]